ncbi:MAG: histidine kinase [Ferruginibacter sp.]
MRLQLIILFLFSFGLASGQSYKPVGEANSYTLKTADGFPGNNYVSDFEYTPSGKVYAKDFFGDLHITGNNFIKYVPDLNNISNSASLIVRSDSEAWLMDESMNITVIRHDTLWRTIESSLKNPINFFSYRENKQVYCIEVKDSKLALYVFKNYRWQKLIQIPINHKIDGNILYGFITKDGRMILNTSIHNDSVRMYEIDTTNLKLRYITTIPISSAPLFNVSLYNDYLQKNKTFIKSLKSFMAKRIPHSSLITDMELEKHFKSLYPYPAYVFRYGHNLYEYFTVKHGLINPATTLFESPDRLNNIRINSAYPYLSILTENEPFRVFPYIKKYPKIYTNGTSNNIFTLVQDDKGRIWAGSYQNMLSIIDDPLSPNHAHGIILLKKQSNPFMNASLNYGGKIYLVGEFMTGGILRYDMDGRMTKLAPCLPTGFYLYLAPKSQTVYYPSAGPGYPVYYCNVMELGKRFVHWKKLDTTSGILPFGMASITEDTLGRIWMGHPKKGFAVYNPKTRKGKTYQTKKNKTPIGFISSLTDKRGTVWMGSDNHGLWYYNDYHKAPTPKNIHQINHPLLNKVKRITSMAIYKGWLVMCCYNRVCLLNLDSFYQKKKVILRYLNPQEASFTSYTEQNTMLVSKVDSSLWFSTSDMLYRWDIGTWLHLPTYKVNVNTFLQYDSKRLKMSLQKQLKLSSSIHSFNISFEYLSPDGLPRYTRTALVRKGDSINYSEPGMESHFSYENLNSGSYIFYLEVFEQNGTTSLYKFSFFINRYLWQHWWFWTVVTLLFLLPFVLWFNARRRQALQEKEISQMNLVTLSNQFRPHFILNALNAIGADLKSNPEAESIISRLGESINLIFTHVQQKRVSHSLCDEWALIKNVIQILRIMYLPELQVSIKGEELLSKYKDLELPLGSLEIHVENALLHGLRNKKSPPYNLNLEIEEDDKNLYFTIKDNGIGREAAMAIRNYKKNGVGTKNLNNIILILNKYNKNKIGISYTDLPQTENSGTIVTIKIPKEYYFKY